MTIIECVWLTTPWQQGYQRRNGEQKRDIYSNGPECRQQHRDLHRKDPGGSLEEGTTTEQRAGERG